MMKATPVLVFIAVSVCALSGVRLQDVITRDVEEEAVSGTWTIHDSMHRVRGLRD